MTYDEKVHWLFGYQRALRREKLLEEELQKQKNRALCCSSAMDCTAHGSSDGQRLARTVEGIIAAEMELECQINVCSAIRHEVVDVINAVPDVVDQDILRLKYLLGNTHEQIAEKMNYSIRQIGRRHKAAVQALCLEDKYE